MICDGFCGGVNLNVNGVVLLKMNVMTNLVLFSLLYSLFAASVPAASSYDGGANSSCGFGGRAGGVFECLGGENCGSRSR